MRHSSFRRWHHPGRRGTPRLLRCEPLEHRWLLSITVDTLVDEADGSIDDGDISLRDAIAVAASGETIDFAPALDGGIIALDAALGELQIAQLLVIDAATLAGGIAIDAQGNSRVISVQEDADLTLTGLTITGGYTAEDGGGISSAGNLTISHCTITGNAALGGGELTSGGGGIFVFGSTSPRVAADIANTLITDNHGGGVRAFDAELTLTRCSISGNSGGGLTGSEWSGLEVADSVITGNEGDGIYLAPYSRLNVARSTISGNQGSGIFGHFSRVTVDDSTISNNTTQGNGGGIYFTRQDTVGYSLSITRTTISGNHSGGYGGGISVYGPATITDSIISGNTAGGNGGGIEAAAIDENGFPSIINSTIAGNTAAGDGGGIWAFRRTNITNSTISGNRSVGLGGGVFSYSGMGISHCTITANQSGGTSGGGVVSYGYGTSVRSSVIAGNLASDVDFEPTPWSSDNLFSSGGYNLIGTGNALDAFTNNDQTGVTEPGLAPLADNGGPTETHALLAGSPAIDAGDPAFAPPPIFDQRGNPRLADGNADAVARIDMGAFEVLRGDLNGDGEVNGLDVDPFVDVLLNGPPSATADMNADGNVNGLDVDSFVAEVVGGAVPVGALDAERALNILDVGSTGRQLHRRLPIHNPYHGNDPAQVIHRRTVQHPLTRQSRPGDSVREAGQRSPPGDMVHDVQHEASGSWHVVVDLAMRDDTNWDRLR